MIDEHHSFHEFHLENTGECLCCKQHCQQSTKMWCKCVFHRLQWKWGKYCSSECRWSKQKLNKEDIVVASPEVRAKVNVLIRGFLLASRTVNTNETVLQVDKVHDVGSVEHNTCVTGSEFYILVLWHTISIQWEVFSLEGHSLQYGSFIFALGLWHLLAAQLAWFQCTTEHFDASSISCLLVVVVWHHSK